MEINDIDVPEFMKHKATPLRTPAQQDKEVKRAYINGAIDVFTCLGLFTIVSILLMLIEIM